MNNKIISNEEGVEEMLREKSVVGKGGKGVTEVDLGLSSFKLAKDVSANSRVIKEQEVGL